MKVEGNRVKSSKYKSSAIKLLKYTFNSTVFQFVTQGSKQTVWYCVLECFKIQMVISVVAETCLNILTALAEFFTSKKFNILLFSNQFKIELT